MRLLHKHPNVISLTNLWSRDEDNELYITMELMDSDLHQIIQSKQSLSEPHHQCLMKQLLLRRASKLGVLHRDLKPGNLLVTRDCQLRITDFAGPRLGQEHARRQGERRGHDRVRRDALVPLPRAAAGTAHSLRRRHRPLEWGHLRGAAEPRLFPGKSYVHQVQVILDVLGTPPRRTSASSPATTPRPS